MPRGTPKNPKRQDRAGRPNQSAAASLKNMPGDFNQYTAESITPELLQGKNTGGEVTQGRNANLIGGGNASSELANLLGAAVQGTAQVAKAASDLATIRDRNEAEIVEKDLNAKKEWVSRGTDDDGNKYSEADYQAYATSQYADLKGRLWTRSGKMEYDTKEYDAQAKVRPLTYTEIEQKANTSKSQILNREYASLDEKAAALEDWTKTWGPRLTQAAGENVSLKDRANAVLSGVETETYNARFLYTDEVIETAWGDVNHLVNDWIDSYAMQGKLIPESTGQRVQEFNEFVVSQGGMDILNDDSMGPDLIERVNERVEEGFRERRSYIDNRVNSNRIIAIGDKVNNVITGLAGSREMNRNPSDLKIIVEAGLEQVGIAINLGGFDNMVNQIDSIVALRREYIANSRDISPEEANDQFLDMVTTGIGANVPDETVDQIKTMLEDRPISEDGLIGQTVKNSLDNDFFKVNSDNPNGVMTPNLVDARTNQLGKVNHAERTALAQDSASAAMEVQGMILASRRDVFASSKTYLGLSPEDQEGARTAIQYILGEYQGDWDEARGRALATYGSEQATNIENAWKVYTELVNSSEGYSVMRTNHHYINEMSRTAKGEYDPARVKEVTTHFTDAVRNDGVIFEGNNTSDFVIKPYETRENNALLASAKTDTTRAWIRSDEELEPYRRTHRNPVKIPEKGVENISAMMDPEINPMITALEGKDGIEIGPEYQVLVSEALGMDVSEGTAKRLVEAYRRTKEDYTENPGRYDAAVDEFRMMVTDTILRDEASSQGKITHNPAEVGNVAARSQSDGEALAYKSLATNRLTIPNLLDRINFTGNEQEMLIQEGIIATRRDTGDLSLSDVQTIINSTGYRLEVVENERVKADGTLDDVYGYELVRSEALTQEGQQGHFAGNWGNTARGTFKATSAVDAILASQDLKPEEVDEARSRLKADIRATVPNGEAAAALIFVLEYKPENEEELATLSAAVSLYSSDIWGENVMRDDAVKMAGTIGIPPAAAHMLLGNKVKNPMKGLTLDDVAQLVAGASAFPPRFEQGGFAERAFYIGQGDTRAYQMDAGTEGTSYTVEEGKTGEDSRFRYIEAPWLPREFILGGGYNSTPDNFSGYAASRQKSPDFYKSAGLETMLSEDTRTRLFANTEHSPDYESDAEFEARLQRYRQEAIDAEDRSSPGYVGAATAGPSARPIANTSRLAPRVRH